MKNPSRATAAEQAQCRALGCNPSTWYRDCPLHGGKVLSNAGTSAPKTVRPADWSRTTGRDLIVCGGSTYVVPSGTCWTSVDPLDLSAELHRLADVVIDSTGKVVKP